MGYVDFKEQLCKGQKISEEFLLVFNSSKNPDFPPISALAYEKGLT